MPNIMKNLILIGLFTVLNAGLFAQDNNVVREEFYANGNLKLKFIEIAPNLVEATYYFETGELYETGYFKNELLSGKWTTYNIDSELQTIGYFHENQKTGTWAHYKDGKEFQVVDYSYNQIAKK
jgi:antitoxin component YwqK of YwqJK toxin-antitoxin module